MIKNHESETEVCVANAREIGSSLEEMTYSINEDLNLHLANLDVALLDAFNDHFTLPFYKWLYLETQSYLHAAQSAMNVEEHIKNYTEHVQQKLISELQKECYKKISIRKQELFHYLIKFYKAIMLFKADIGKRVVVGSDDAMTSYCIEELNKQILSAQHKIIEPRKRITKIQVEIEEDLEQLTLENVLVSYALNIDRHLQHELWAIPQDFERALTELKDSKDAPHQLLVQAEKKIAEIKQLKISEKKWGINNNLMDEMKISCGISQLFNRLESEEKELGELCGNNPDDEKSITLKVALEKIMDVTEVLLQQKDFLSKAFAGGFVSSVELKPCIDALCEKVTQQTKKPFSVFSKWRSKNPCSILSSLEEIRYAAQCAYAISPICNDIALQKRRDKIELKLEIVNKKFNEMTEVINDLKKNSEKTKKLKIEFFDKKRKLEPLVKRKFEEIHRKKIKETQMRLDILKNQYLIQFDLIADQCKKKIKFKEKTEQPEHFCLPKVRKYLIPGVVSEFAGVGVAALAAVAFISTTPVGWGVAAAITAGSLLIAGGVFLSKAYHRYKDNKLIKQYEKSDQKDSYETNKNLKKLKICSTTRRLIIENKLTMDRNSFNQDKKEVVLVKKGFNKARLFWNKDTKKLRVGSLHSVAKEPVDMLNINNQLNRFEI